MNVWIVIYEHKHGVDCWPVVEKPSITQVKEELRAAGSWDEDDDRGEQSFIEIRGPWCVSFEQAVLRHAPDFGTQSE